jgi:RNA polymerase sigma-70 factor (ECF subfamily)
VRPAESDSYRPSEEGRKRSEPTPTGMAVLPAKAIEPSRSAKTQRHVGAMLVAPVQSDQAQFGPDAAPGHRDLESRAWIEGLRGTEGERVRTLERLHDLLLRATRSEAHRRRYLYPEIGGSELDDVCQQAADDALVAVTNKLDGYRGASRFTTWAYAFAVFEVSVKLRRHAWRGHSIPTADDDVTWDRLASSESAAHAGLESRELLRALRRAVAEELTPRQREVFVAVVLNDVEIDVLAEQLQSTRGAVYKVLHDARRKLRLFLERDGHLKQVET